MSAGGGSGSAPLAGRTVVVTRATEQAGELAGLLRAAGAQVVELPLITTVDPPDGDAALGAALTRPFDWVIVTSPNGARRVAATLARLGAPPEVAFRLAAIGRGTEAALGRRADLVPTRQVAEGLLAEFRAAPGRILLVQGDQARPVLAEGLRAAGHQVEQVVAYLTVPTRPAAARLAEVAAADAVTFASGSAVRSFVAAAGRDALPRVVVSIGPITTQVAGGLGVTVDRTAAEHTLPGLVAAVVAALGDRPERPAGDPGSR